ncbi:MAG TPA: glycosyltransferase family 2 protein [Solirubrobacteraceae bacterium]|nr:glycosyltransferase family 2 protein [Solirubrobacteraceae bacterium]
MSATAIQPSGSRDRASTAEHDDPCAATTSSEGRYQPDLSILVVTHNRAELALMTIGSARAATRGLTVQWIVVDSGSSDGTPEKIQAAYPDVRVLREQNIGFAAANNRGLPLAHGRYVLLLNPDVQTCSGTFADLLSKLDSKPRIGVASVIQTTPGGHLERSIRRFPSPWRSIGEALAAPRLRGLRRLGEEESRPRAYRNEASADWLVGAFLIARAQALREVGPLDERFFLYSEETDWCYRFRLAGWEVSHLPVMTVVHHTSRVPRPDLCAQLSHAKILFARKHYGTTRAGAIRAALALRHALRAGLLSLVARIRPARVVQASAERHALAVVLGLTRAPFER